MAAANITDKFVTSFSELYVSATAVSAASDEPTETELRTWFTTSASTFLVPLVAEIGNISNEATVIDTPEFGKKFKGKLRGQLDGGSLDAQLYWAPRDATHILLRDWAENGTAIHVGIKWKSTASDTSDAEYVYFDSFVSSFGIDTAFDDVAKASATFIVDGTEYFAAST